MDILFKEKCVGTSDDTKYATIAVDTREYKQYIFLYNKKDILTIRQGGTG
jgi:hypothetical protein